MWPVKSALIAFVFIYGAPDAAAVGPFVCAPKEYFGTGQYYAQASLGGWTSNTWICPPGVPAPASAASAAGFHLTYKDGHVPGAACAGGAPAAAASAAVSPDPLGVLNSFMIACQAEPAASTPDGDAYVAVIRAARAKTDALWNLDHPVTPPTIQWWVTSTTAYPLNADGTRSITAWPAKAQIHEPCDCATKVLQFGATFCKVPTLTTPAQVVVAGCGIQK